jgi:class 3 adenylate cyclase
MNELPSGTVTFLFSDIEGSTRLLQQLGDRWGELIGAHNALLRKAFTDAGGREVDRQGDAFFAVFPRARDALAAAATSQRELTGCDWPDGVEVRVRMGVHTGEPALGDEGYLGLDVVRAARICALARGGQVLVSAATRALVGAPLDALSLQDVGEHRLKDIDDPEQLYELRGPGLRDDLPLPAATAPSTEMVLDVADRQIELANRALAQLGELDFGPLERLGPRIKQQVGAALADMPPEERDEAAQEIGHGLDALARLPVSPGWVIVISVAFGLLVAGVVVALLVWLVTALL